MRACSTNCCSALNLRNAPNRLFARRLQQMLGGEYHETCFWTCWPRRTRRRCFIRCRPHRRRLSTSRAATTVDTGRLHLQRMGSLLAPPLRRWRLLPSALLGWSWLAPSLGLWRGYGWPDMGWSAGVAGVAATAGITGATGTSGNHWERGFGPLSFWSPWTRSDVAKPRGDVEGPFFHASTRDNTGVARRGLTLHGVVLRFFGEAPAALPPAIML